MRVRGACAPALGGFVRFARHDERGSLTLLMLVLLLGILLMTGFAMEMMRHETERAGVQHALDNGTLAATSLRSAAKTKAEVQAVVERFIDTRSARTTDVTVRTRLNTLNSATRDVSASAHSMLPTSFLSWTGVEELAIGAGARAYERNPNMELSLILDTSNSMCDPCTKIDALKVAAKDFVTEVVGPNTDKKLSVNLIRYNWHVNVGPWVFDKLAASFVDDDGDSDTAAVSNRDPAYGSCYQTKFDELIDAADMTAVALAETAEAREELLNALGTIPNFPRTEARGQITDAKFVRDDGTVTSTTFTAVCPEDTYATRYMEHSAQTLRDEIEEIVIGNDSTATYLAMQWGLALLHPESQPMISEMSDEGLVDAAFASRPGAWDDADTQKIVVLFTDGKLNVQGDFYTPFGDPVPSLAKANEVFDTQCLYARTRGIRVFTIAFEAPEAAEIQMRDCATVPSMFYKADTNSISAVFDQIARDIQALKLTN